METYRVGVAGLVHDHVWGELRHWRELPNAEVVAAADVNEPLREQIKQQHGVEKLYESWGEMLEQEELDVVQIAGENSKGAEIVEAAAGRGLHCVSEKPMAARLEQAERMLKAAQGAGVVLMVNWPSQWSAEFQTMARMIEGGEIGDLFYYKFRSAHNGPKEIGCSEYFWQWLYDEELNGAGAFMDYCCYGAVMCAALLGLPRSCVGYRGTFVKDYPIPDDNAMVVMKYDHALGVTEASWTQVVKTVGPNPLAYGTTGALGIDGGKLLLYREGEDPEPVEAEPLAAGRRTGPEHLLHCIETGEEPMSTVNAVTSRNAQEILEAGLISADTGKAVELPVG